MNHYKFNYILAIVYLVGLVGSIVLNELYWYTESGSTLELITEISYGLFLYAGVISSIIMSISVIKTYLDIEKQNKPGPHNNFGDY